MWLGIYFLQNVKDDSNAPVVAFFAVGFLLEDFRGHIAGGTAGSRGENFITDEPSETKIGDLDDGSASVLG